MPKCSFWSNSIAKYHERRTRESDAATMGKKEIRFVCPPMHCMKYTPDCTHYKWNERNMKELTRHRTHQDGISAPTYCKMRLRNRVHVIHWHGISSAGTLCIYIAVNYFDCSARNHSVEFFFCRKLWMISTSWRMSTRNRGNCLLSIRLNRCEAIRISHVWNSDCDSI